MYPSECFINYHIPDMLSAENNKLISNYYENCFEIDLLNIRTILTKKIAFLIAMTMTVQFLQVNYA